MSSSTRRIQQQQQQQQQNGNNSRGGGSSTTTDVVSSRFLSRDNYNNISSSVLSSQQLLHRRRESIKNLVDVDKIQVSPGVSLQGIELENFCRKRGLCPLCAKVQIRKRIFKLFKKAKWEPLTITSSNKEDSSSSGGSSSGNDKASSKGQGGYLVYKGYCLSENCFTLEQAKTLAGDNKDNNNNNNSSSNRRSRREDSGGNSSRPPRSSTSQQQPQRNRSKTKRSVFAGGSASSSLTGTTNKSYQQQQQHQDDINDIDSTGGDGGGGNGRGNNAGHQQTNTTTNHNNHNHNNHHNKINLTSHKPDPKAFPPPELKSTTNFEIHDDKPYFVIEKSAVCLKEDTVTILDLSNLLDLRLIDIQAISTALQVNTTLQSLIFENCSLTDEYVNIIGEGLHEAKDIPLTKLYLRSNSMGDDAIDSLCPFLEANTTLEKIDVSRNKITSRGGVAIFNAFQRNRLSRIRCINLGHNELWNLTEDKFGIQSFLLRNRTIQVLNLEANYISDDGCEAITHGLIDNDQTCLERLYLGWNSIGDDGLIALSQLLETNTSLKVLGIGENQIKNAGARSLLVAMNYNTTIKEISGLWRNQIERRFIIVAIRRLLLSPNRVVGVEEERTTTRFTTLMEQQQQQPPSLSKSYSSNSTRSRSWKDSIEQAPVTIDSRMDDVDAVTTGVGGGGGGDYGGGMMISNTTTYSIPSADSQDNNTRESQQQQQNEEGGENVAVLPAASAASAGRQQQQNPNLQQPNRMIQMKQKLGGSTSSKMSSFKSLLSGGKPMSGKSISSSTTIITPADHETIHQSTAKSPLPPPLLVNGSTSTEVEQQQQQQQQQKYCDSDNEDVLHIGGGNINNDDIVPYDCLTVIQSAPLAYFDRETGIHKAVPLIDYQSELKTIKEAVREAVGARIDVLQEMATLEGLTGFFNDDGGGGRRRVMHFTSYGGHNSDHQIELENGYGSIHTLPVDGLKRLMEDEEGNGTGRGSNGNNNNNNSLHSGGCCLRVVFVSSCHSRAIGQAFVDAGVPHVVCCQREKKYHDELVSEFTHKFYRALADNKLLQQAFNIALKTVNASGCSKKSRLVTERFFLLPEPSENNTYIHEVPVFFTQTMTPRSSSADNAVGPFHFPKSPKNFLGREVDMYEILEALRVDDVVKILSPVGHGKDSVVAAVCEYAMQRRNIFSVDDIFWLPSPAGVIPEEDSLYGDLSLTINIIKNSQEDIWETDEVLLECRERIEIELEELQVVLVIDDRDFKFRGSQEGLEKFISYVLNSANAKVIMITSRRSSELTSTHSTLSTSTSGSRIEEASIEIGPLDFKSTARLFGENSKYIASNGCPAAHSGNEFAELLEPAFISKMPDPSLVISQRRSDLFLRMGNGLPSRVINAAESMSKDDFIDLIGIANRPEVFVDSLGALEKELEFRKLQRERAIEERNFMRAMDLDIILEELEGMRPEFPTLYDLREEEALMKEELAAAVKNRHYDTANDLKRELLTLKKKIMKEQRLAPDNTKDTSDRLNALQAQVQSMIEGAELTHDVNTDVKSATFAVQCDGRDCSFVIYPGEVYEFEHPSEAMGIVCWGNESCELKGTEVGHKLLERGGPLLEDEIAKLPIKMSSPYGPIRCGTGNALILGPEEFGDLEAPCVILSVGPLSPTNSQVDAIDDNTDSLHHITMMLRSCYRSSLVLARHAELQALAISLLTTRKEGQAYAHTLRLGLKTLIEEVKFSHLRDLHIAASSQKEASILIAMMSEMGYRQIYN